MRKITPHLWYDNQAKEAATFYCGLFDDSKILSTTLIGDTPSGDAETVSFQLAGQQFAAISAGPYFSFNPSVSLMVACSSIEEVNIKWNALIDGGIALMPLQSYPFSKWYGWVQDRYGLSWQLMLVEGEQPSQKITPNLLFSAQACGEAETAIEFYTQVFSPYDSSIDFISRYGEGEAESKNAKINYESFQLGGMHFSAMDNGFDVDYGFNEAFSFMVDCKDQTEIDYFWSKLSAVPEAEQCGWLKDQFGLSWQIVPSSLEEIMSTGTPEQMQRITEAFLKMKKFDLAELEKARLGI